MNKQNTMAICAAIIFAAGDCKIGEATHFASQIVDSVEAREARNAPNWVSAAEAVLKDELPIKAPKAPELKDSEEKVAEEAAASEEE